MKHEPWRYYKKEGMTKCKECGLFKPAFRTSRNGKPRFVNEKGKLWCGKICAECKRNKNTIYNRKTGIRPIDDVPGKSKQRWSERLVQKYFNDLGFETSITTSLGPDVVFWTKENPGNKITVEVKNVFERKHHGRISSLMIPAVRPQRMGDDLIAFVFSNGVIHMESMTDHLKLCSNSGIRTVTSMIGLLGG